jgi:phosphoserine phosphatase
MADSQNLIMVVVSGRDRPGIIARFTRLIMSHQGEVLDMEQASPHNLLGLYFILDLSKSTHSPDSVIKDLLFEANQLDLNLDFRSFSPQDLRALNQRSLYVLTHFGGTAALAELSGILADQNVNIETITTAAHHGSRSMEMTIDAQGVSGIDRLKQRLMVKSRELNIAIGLQKMEAYRKNKRLIFFDMDSTLVDLEIIDEMARRAGVHREVARITEKAMRGEFDFESSLIQRVALLKGLGEREMIELRESIPLSPGVEDLATTLKYLGYKLGIVTGGFDFFADHMKGKLGFDFVCSNKLEIKDRRLTGKVVGEVVDGAMKARFVNQTACDHGILLDQTVCVGDGANDALMLSQAGLAIAYNPKKGLDRVANVSMGRSPMTDILHLLGITEEDISDALACRAS